MRKLGEEKARDFDTKSRNRSGIMPLCPDAANREAGSRAETSGRVAVVGRRVRRGKNDFALPPGSRMRQCKESRDDEIRASLDPRSVLSRVLVLTPGNPARSSNAVWLIGLDRQVLCRPGEWRASI